MKQRLVGAVFILSLGVILIPIILDKPAKEVKVLSSRMPPAPAMPDVSEVSKIHYVFDNPVVALNEPETEPQTEVASVPAPIADIPEPVKQKAHASLAQVSLDSWTIQLGAFSSEKNAKELMEKLTARGFEPYIRKMNEDALVRVYISPGVSRDQAVSLISKLDNELGLKGIVVRYFQ